MSMIYVIVNEFTPKGSEYELTEVLQPGYDTYQDALDALFQIAEEVGAYYNEADDDSFDVSVDNDSHLEADRYYILDIEVITRG